MPKKKPPDPSDKPQRQKFIETAKELGVDETGAEFDRAIDGLLRPPKQKKT